MTRFSSDILFPFPNFNDLKQPCWKHNVVVNSQYSRRETIELNPVPACWSDITEEKMLWKKTENVKALTFIKQEWVLFHMIISAWDWLVFVEKYHASQKIIHNSVKTCYIYFDKISSWHRGFTSFFFQSFWILAQVINIVSSNIFHWKSVKESKVSMVFGAKFGPN